jgi:hypothetical protein
MLMAILFTLFILIIIIIIIIIKLETLIKELRQQIYSNMYNHF